MKLTMGFLGDTLTRRAIAEEQMDSLDLPLRDYGAILGDLAQVNTFTLAARPTLAFLEKTVPPGARLRLLDVGYGQGDMLRRIARWAAQRAITAELVGIDLNPHSVPVARTATPTGQPIDFLTGDYSSLAGQEWDVVISSLVAHHMKVHELTDFLRFMEHEARLGWFINDLHRHRLAHALYPLLARVMRWHRVVREDGTLSIARAFRPVEWASILKRAGVTAARVERHFPFRLCVARQR